MVASRSSRSATASAARRPPPDTGPRSLHDDRHAALAGAKLRALVRDQLGLDGRDLRDAELGPLPGGATLAIDGRGFVYVADEPRRALGPALAWSRRQGLRQLDLIVDADSGVLARRATQFLDPPTVWEVDGRSLRAATPASYPAPNEPSAAARAFTALLEEAGATVLVEHGEVVGEVRGLEIARVVPDGAGARLEVGVGRHDREAFAVMHGDVPTAQALAGVVRLAGEHRRPGADPHPLNRLAQERWLRDRLVREPALVGARRLRPTEPALARENVKDPTPAPAVGEDDAGRTVVVVASVGVDLDLVPAAADVRTRDEPDARLVLVVPARDDLPVTRELAAALAAPAEVFPVPGDWRGRSGSDADS